MPNWCANKLTVENATEEFCDYLRDCGFSFNKIVPIEDNENDEQKLAEQNATWGTKWDLDKDEQKQVAFELIENNTVYFDTAWSPPTGIMEPLSEQFPTVDFRLDYCELGCWYAGTCYATNGLAIDEEVDDDEALKEFANSVFGYEFDDEEEEVENYSTTPNLSCQENNLYDPEDEQ